MSASIYILYVLLKCATTAHAHSHWHVLHQAEVASVIFAWCSQYEDISLMIYIGIHALIKL